MPPSGMPLAAIFLSHSVSGRKPRLGIGLGPITKTTSKPGAPARPCCVMTWMPSLDATKPPSTDNSTER